MSSSSTNCSRSAPERGRRYESRDVGSNGTGERGGDADSGELGLGIASAFSWGRSENGCESIQCCRHWFNWSSKLFTCCSRRATCEDNLKIHNRSWWWIAVKGNCKLWGINPMVHNRLCKEPWTAQSLFHEVKCEVTDQKAEEKTDEKSNKVNFQQTRRNKSQVGIVSSDYLIEKSFLAGCYALRDMWHMNYFTLPLNGRFCYPCGIFTINHIRNQ